MESDSISRIARLFKVGFVLASAVVLIVFFFTRSQWHISPLPPDPDATRRLMEFIVEKGGDRGSVVIHSQQKRCGQVSFSYVGGAQARDSGRFVVDQNGKVFLDDYGLGTSFGSLWRDSPCWIPPNKFP